MIAANKSPNETARQLIGRDYLSYSAISLYRRCPLAFKFKYIDALPEPEVSSSLVFGLSIHAAIQHHFEQLMVGTRKPTLDELLVEFWDCWREKAERATVRLGKRESAASLALLAESVLEVFQQSEHASPQGRVVGVEEPVRATFLPDAPDLFGRLDLLLLDCGSLTIIDFKTAKSHKGFGTAHDSGEQLLLYGDALRKIGHVGNLSLQYVVFDKSKSPTVKHVPVATHTHLVERAKRVVANVWRAIESQHFFPTPSPMNCGSCPFREPCANWCG